MTADGWQHFKALCRRRPMVGTLIDILSGMWLGGFVLVWTISGEPPEAYRLTSVVLLTLTLGAVVVWIVRDDAKDPNTRRSDTAIEGIRPLL